jgi:hypothetical protein
MAAFPTADASAKKEVSESAFEYLLGEILARESVLSSGADSAAATEQRLELLGYNVGYR